MREEVNMKSNPQLSYNIQPAIPMQENRLIRVNNHLMHQARSNLNQSMSPSGKWTPNAVRQTDEWSP